VQTPIVFFRPVRRSSFVFVVLLFVIPSSDDITRRADLTGMYLSWASASTSWWANRLLNLGYVAFYAIGAYTYAILSTRFGLKFCRTCCRAARPLHGALSGCPPRLRGAISPSSRWLGEITRIVLKLGE